MKFNLAGKIRRADISVRLANVGSSKRDELAKLYARVLDAANGRRVAFRTLDIGSDKEIGRASCRERVLMPV